MQNIIKEMSLDAKKKAFINILSRDTRKGMPEFLKWLETETNFFEAPAELEGTGAYTGGLLDKSLSLYQRLAREVFYEYASDERINELSAHANDWRAMVSKTTAIEALLHDICKTNFYETYLRNVKEEYRVRDDILGYGHGEESVYILSGFVKLDPIEMLSIRHHMGPSASNSEETSRVLNTYKSKIDPTSLHIADMKATYVDEANGQNYSDSEKFSDEKCQEIFVDALKATEREGINRLLKYIQEKTDFFTAPASTRYHESRKGGLLRHSLNVYARMQRETLNLLYDDEIDFNIIENSEELKKDLSSIALVGLTSEIWKANTYVQGGNGFKISDNAFGFGKGDESVQLLREYVALTREEAFTIRYSDCYFGTGTSNMSKAFEMYPLLPMMYSARLKNLCLR